MAKGVKFGEGSARRIIAATRAYERGNRDQPPVKFRTVGDDGTPIKIGKTVAPWIKGETQEVSLVFEDSCDEEGYGSGGESLLAHNQSFDVNGGRIVKLALAENGCWYLVQAESCVGEGDGSGGCHCPGIGGEDLTQLPDYDPGETQVLGHENGCLKWITTTSCEEGSS
jgi:hypothetical protein